MLLPSLPTNDISELGVMHRDIYYPYALNTTSLPLQSKIKDEGEAEASSKSGAAGNRKRSSNYLEGKQLLSPTPVASNQVSHDDGEKNWFNKLLNQTLYFAIAPPCKMENSRRTCSYQWQRNTLLKEKRQK